MPIFQVIFGMLIINFSMCALQKQNSMQLMVQIEVMLKDNKSFTAITTILQEYKDKLDQEQIRHNQIFKSQNDECLSEIKFRIDQIDTTYSQVNKENIKLKNCEDEKERLLVSYEESNIQLIKYQDRLQTIIKMIQQGALENSDREQSFITALETLNQALSTFKESNNMKQESLLFVSKNMIHEAIATESIEIYGPALQLLYKIKIEDNDEDKDQLEDLIIKVLEDLKEAVSKKLLKLRTDTQLSQDLLLKQRRKLQESIHRSVNQRELQKEKIESIIICVGEEAANLQAVTTELHMNTVQKKSAESMCKLFDIEYKKITESRKSEIQFAGNIEEMVRKRMAEENRLRTDI